LPRSMPTERICMSMILLEPANTILQTSGEDQAADHLINGVLSKFECADPARPVNLPKTRHCRQLNRLLYSGIPTLSGA
jgi:hypothetical protein